MQRFYALDALRGLFAIFVCLFHMHLLNSFSELSFFHNSYIFVEFFFVLSGFVIAHSYGFRDRLKFRPFFSARFFRLYPLHLFMFCMVFILEFIKLIAIHLGLWSEAMYTPFSNGTAFSEILPNLLLIHAWTPFTDSFSFNYQSWSISIEFYMYMLFFISVIALKEYKKLTWIVLSLSMICFLSVNSCVLTTAALRGVLCFFSGASAYLFYRRFKDFKINYFTGSVLECSSVVLTVFTVSTSSVLEHQLTAVLVLFITLVVLFAFESGCISTLFKKQIFQTIGRLSYSIYMIHSFVLTVFYIVAKRLFGMEQIIIGNITYISTGNYILDSLITVIIIIVIVLLSHFSYKYIEMKGLQFSKKVINK